MKTVAVILLLFLVPALSQSQNIPACDSLVIECCSFEVDQNTVSLIASNYSSYLFDYPGFILFNSDMDTMAIETVNYFGISTDQPHWLTIIHPFSLPFDGILELHVLFYDSLTCTFEITIPDTVTSSVKDSRLADLRIFPNPVTDQLNIAFGSSEPVADIDVRIVNILGQEKLKYRLTPSGMQIPAGTIGEPGLYFIQITDALGHILETRKLLLR
jgi:hypothetical protein